LSIKKLLLTKQYFCGDIGGNLVYNIVLLCVSLSKFFIVKMTKKKEPF